MYRSLRCGYVGILVVLWGGLLWGNRPAIAYEQFSQDGGDATNCGACHGDFRSGSYVSLSDGTNWGNLHNLTATRC